MIIDTEKIDDQIEAKKLELQEYRNAVEDARAALNAVENEMAVLNAAKQLLSRNAIKNGKDEANTGTAESLERNRA
jgi:hypothetical protein